MGVTMVKKNMLVLWLPAVLSLLLALGTATVFSACGPIDPSSGGGMSGMGAPSSGEKMEKMQEKDSCKCGMDSCDECKKSDSSEKCDSMKSSENGMNKMDNQAPKEMKQEKKWMRCHRVQNIVVMCAIVMAVIFILSAFINGREVGFLLNVIGALISAVTIFIPGNILPMCKMQTMRCYTVMQPFVRVMCALIIIAAIVNIVFNYKKKNS